MHVTRKTRRQARFENLVFLALFLALVGLLAWLSTRYSYEADWTAAGRNTLSEATVTSLAGLPGDVQITAYARETEVLRRHIGEVIGRYQRHKPDIHLSFVNPDTVPDEVRRLGIRVDGELLIQYQGRTEKLPDLNEQGLTNALQRLARGGERWVAMLEGHGERGPDGASASDLAALGRELRAKGFKLQGLNLVTQPAIPDNTTLLVIASPRNGLLPGEVTLIADYLDRGGNMLWLVEPGPALGLEPLAEKLGLRFLSGTVVDPVAVQLFGAAFVLVGDYKPNPITRGLDALTLFPEVAAVETLDTDGWEPEVFLDSSERSWAERGELKGDIAFDEGTDLAGPLAFGVSLQRERPDAGPTDAGGEAAAKQRVVVIGDGDFLSDAYLGNGANLSLGLNLFNWLSEDEKFIAVPPKTAPDLTLELSRSAMLFMAAGFLLALPAALGGSGLLIWLRRRKR